MVNNIFENSLTLWRSIMWQTEKYYIFILFFEVNSLKTSTEKGQIIQKKRYKKPKNLIQSSKTTKNHSNEDKETQNQSDTIWIIPYAFRQSDHRINPSTKTDTQTIWEPLNRETGGFPVRRQPSGGGWCSDQLDLACLSLVWETVRDQSTGMAGIIHPQCILHNGYSVPPISARRRSCLDRVWLRDRDFKSALNFCVEYWSFDVRDCTWSFDVRDCTLSFCVWFFLTTFVPQKHPCVLRPRATRIPVHTPCSWFLRSPSAWICNEHFQK